MARQVTAEPTEQTDGAGRRKLAVPRTFAALRNHDFRLLWTGTLGSFTAMQMQLVARGYLAYALTGSATSLGLVTLARGLPQMVFTLVGGVLADRVKKRNLLLVTQSLTGLCALTTAMLVATGWIEIWHLIVLGALEGTIFSFTMPTRQAFLAELVPQQEMMNAIALNSAGMNFTRIFGPALAGTLITIPAIGVGGVFFVVAACYLLPVSMIWQLKPKYAVARRAKAPMRQEFLEGIRYIVHHETLAMLIALGLVPILLGFSYQTLLPVFASAKVLDVGASGLGLMSTAAGVGALAGALGVASISHMRRRGLLQLATGAGFGVTLLLFALSPSFHVALAALLFVGFTGGVYQSLNTTLIMSQTDPAYYGRVMSVQQVGFSLNMMAPLPIGMIVDRIGAPPTVAACGTLVTIFVILVATFFSGYRRLETDPFSETPRPRAAAGA